MSQGLLGGHAQFSQAAADEMNKNNPSKKGSRAGAAPMSVPSLDALMESDPHAKSLFPAKDVIHNVQNKYEPHFIPVPKDMKPPQDYGGGGGGGGKGSTEDFVPKQAAAPDASASQEMMMDPYQGMLQQAAMQQAAMMQQGMWGGQPGFGGMPMMMPGYPYMGMQGMDMSGGKGMPYPGMMPGMMPGMAGMGQGAAPYMGGAPKSKGAGKGKGNAGDKNEKGDNKERRKRGKNVKGNDKPQSDDKEEDNVNRSAALIEVRKSQGKATIDPDQVREHAVEFAKDQHGSRYLQGFMGDDQKDEAKARRSAIFNILLPHSQELASDMFGNHVIQKLFGTCTKDEKQQLAQKLQTVALSLTQDSYGTRVIQAALTNLSREYQQLLVAEVMPHVGDCIRSMHGNHVIQKCIEQMPPDSVTFIIVEINDNAEYWATQSYGCRVIQRLLEHCLSADKLHNNTSAVTASQLDSMLNKILDCVPKLAGNDYGNYVVQHMLEHGRKEDKAKIIDVIGKNIGTFSKDKYTSNVVEKCIEISAIGEHMSQLKEERKQFYNLVVGPIGDDNCPLMQMLDDKYGNYIVQKLLEYGKGVDDVLKKKLLAQSSYLATTTSGRYILNALNKQTGDNTGRGE